jgi:hypothetical protein
MVIDNFNLMGAGIRPDEADPILVIDAHAVLAFTIPCQSF